LSKRVNDVKLGRYVHWLIVQISHHTIYRWRQIKILTKTVSTLCIQL